MAEVDIRIGTLEDEIKVLKGEVRRTLVDLRALLMREDSPLNDGSLGHRGALSQTGPLGEPGLTRREVLELIKQQSSGPTISPVLVTTAHSPPPASQPPPGPPSGPAFDDPASADRERRLEEQQRRLDEQQQRIEEQERQLAEQRRNAGGPSPDPPAQKQPSDQGERRLDEQHRIMAEREDASAGARRAEAEAAAEPEANKGSEAPEPIGRPWAGELNDVGAPEQAARILPSSGDGARSKLNERGGTGRGRAETQERSDGDSPQAANRVSSRVYHEYLEFAKEAEGQPPPPMDINLLSSLTRWASVAKHRVGEQRLGDILDLYSKSGHLSPVMREVLAQISGMVGEAPVKASHDVEECVDLICHLHGILAGGLSIPQVWLARICNKP